MSRATRDRPNHDTGTSTRTGTRTGTRTETLRAGHGWDLLLAVVLTAVALVGWRSTFDGMGFWIAGGMAILLSAWLAQLVVALGRGLEFVVIALALGFYLLSGPAAYGFELLERPKETFWIGLQAAADCWPILLETHPPVEASGPVLLAPFMLSWFSAGLAVGLAVRSERPAAPVVPPLLMFLTVLLFAQPTPVAASVLGLAFGGGALMWLRIRSLRVESRRHGEDPAWRARVLAGIVLVLVASGLTWLMLPDPPADDDRLVIRDRISAYDVTRLTTPLDEFRSFNLIGSKLPGNVARKRLFRVQGAPDGTLLRIAVLDSYDGHHWTASNDRDEGRTDDRFLRLSENVDNPAGGDLAEIEIAPTEAWTGSGSGQWVPTVGALQSFAFVEPSRPDADAELRYNPATGSAVMTGRLQEGDDYRFTARLPDDDLRKRMEPSPLLDEDVYDQAAFLDPVIAAWAPDGARPMRQLFVLADRLKRVGRYTDGVGAGLTSFTSGNDPQRLGEEFLLADPTAGNDEQYAAAVALLANRLRIPARVVVGASVKKNGVVKGKHVSAWVEIRIADGTWRRLPTDVFMGHQPPVQRPPEGQIPPRDLPKPKPDRPDEKDDRPEKDDSDRADRRDEQQEPATPWWAWLLPLPLTVLLIPIAKALRTRRRRRARPVSRRYAGAWLELTDHARDLGRPVPAGISRTGQATLLEVDRRLASDIDVAVFGPQEPSPDEVAAYWDRTRSARRQLSRSRSRWRRWSAWLNPASLRRR